MNIDTFSNWLTRQGYQVIKSKSSYWYNAGPRVLQAFPYHKLISPDKEELDDLLLHKGNLAVRYSSPVNSSRGMISYHVMLHKPYTLDILRPQARNGVKRGLENCRIEQITMNQLAEDGWALQEDTLIRQDRTRSMKKEEWELICKATSDLPGFEAWAALVDNSLAACLLVARINDIYCVPYAVCHHIFLNLHVNNALFFTVSSDLLSRPGIREIFFSLHSLDAPDSVNEFKFRMGFEAKPVRQCVDLHPLLKPLASSVSVSFLARLLQIHPNQPFLSKMEGMFRFYRNGLVPLENQVWPDCIASRKDEMLGRVPISLPDYTEPALEGSK
jgi:hypothetical protein